MLSDAKKKEIFDKYGEEGLKADASGAGPAGHGGAGGPGFHYTFQGDPMRMFAQAFGGHGGGIFTDFMGGGMGNGPEVGDDLSCVSSLQTFAMFR